MSKKSILIVITIILIIASVVWISRKVPVNNDQQPYQHSAQLKNLLENGWTLAGGDRGVVNSPDGAKQAFVLLGLVDNRSGQNLTQSVIYEIQVAQPDTLITIKESEPVSDSYWVVRGWTNEGIEVSVVNIETGLELSSFVISEEGEFVRL